MCYTSYSNNFDVLWDYYVYVLFGQKQHNLPHIHVKYQDEEAVISILDGRLLDGNVKSNKMKLVQAWIEIHHDELIANWELAINGETVFKIDPLK